MIFKKKLFLRKNRKIIFRKKEKIKFYNFIKCSNKTFEKCVGEFVLILNDTCYFLYKTKKIYQNSQINDLCSKYNQTEIDYSTRYTLDLFFYLLQLSGVIEKYEENIETVNAPWRFFSKLYEKILTNQLL